jgi:hypothetical protein
MVDEDKWSSAIAYTRAYNDWKSALRRHDSDAFHPEVTKLWDALLVAEKEYKRMVKK